MMYSQNRQDYYIEITEGTNLGTIQQIINPDSTVTLTTNVVAFSNFINSKTVYGFRKAFPTATTPILQRLYLMETSENYTAADFLVNEDIVNVSEINNDLILTGSNDPPIYTNDYNELIYENLLNPVLEAVKAPLAWRITKGDPSVLVGISDGPYSPNHEDMDGKVVFEYNISSGPPYHGTQVASLIVATNDNGIGMASIAGWNTNLVFANTNGWIHDLMEGLLLLSQHPGVKVVNASFASSAPFNEYHNAVVEEITASGVLIVASAGNENINAYRYPASYDATLSVTSVGSRYPIGFYHTNGFWHRSWKDCYNGKPDLGEGGNIRNDKVDVCSPNQFIISATTNYSDYPSGYRPQVNTSSAAPVVSGLAALIFSVNPNLTANEVKEIIRNTADDIYYIPYNQPYIGQLGTGRINAYRAVLTAQCMLNPTGSGSLDLVMQNSNLDSFEEPDTETQQPWNSEDIWVRNQDDGIFIKEHENPEYDPNNFPYVYVRVTNNSCQPSTGTDNLKLYWAKANTSLSWPLHWNGTLFITDPNGQDILMGDEIATLTIPPLGIGEEAIIEFQWNNMPNPDDYININNANPWHFCLLARIDTPNDPMTFPESISIAQNVLNNNNISWKNLTIVDINPTAPSPIGGVVAVGNLSDLQKTYKLELFKEENEPGQSLYEEAEVTIEMDEILYNAWERGGKIGQNFDSTSVAKKKIVTGNNVVFDNIIFNPNELGILNVSFHFLTKKLTNKKKFLYHVVQRDALTNELIGGETYQVRKHQNDAFLADAGVDKEIDKNETITLNAAQINEDAVYNWYDPQGNLIYTGTDLTVSPEITIKYKLEIISNIDGFKDYDEVEVTVNPYKLESLVPNPASSQVIINYLAEEATSAYLMVVNMNNGNSNNYVLDVLLQNTTLDISSFTTGLYNIILICDGEVQNSKILIKE